MPASTPITVLIARFDDLLGRGLRQVLDADPSLEVVAQDVELHRLGVILRAHRPRVAILDVDALPNLAAVAELSRDYSNTQLVLIATRPTNAECAQLLAFGASACLGRDTQARDVLSAIHLSARGLQLIPRRPQDADGGGPQHSQLLTRREAEILPLLQQGSSNVQIAMLLQVGVETVRTHARNIYRKLGVSSRRELTPPGRVHAETPDAGNESQLARRWNVAPRERQRRPGSLHR
jgi:two-component system nitrate/nitrite response regulator NarP